MERGSDKHGPLRDEALKSETEGLERAGRPTRAEEWRSPEPAGEDQPDVDRNPDGTLVGGTPPGMSQGDVEGRAELASYLGKEIWPAVGQQLLDLAVERNAPDRVVQQLRRLPAGRVYATVSEVWEALGGGVETERF